MNIKSILLLTFIFASYTLSAQHYSKTIKMVAQDREEADLFGHSLSIAGNNFIVGAYFEDNDENGNNKMDESGSAYIFSRDANSNWIQKQKIIAPDRDGGDLFGYSVSMHANWAIVGAHREDHDVMGLNYKQDAGSAYIFKQNLNGTWIFIQKITASDRWSGDYFGISVAIHGEYIAVGATLDDEDANGQNVIAQSGSVYMFKKDNQDVWHEVVKLQPNDRGVDDLFGYTVSLTVDRLLVGTPYEDHNLSGSQKRTNAGSAYVFYRNINGNWSQEQKLIASDRAPYDGFGHAIDIYEDGIIIGAFEEDEDAVGGNTQSGAGSAYIFKKDAQNIWHEKQKIVGTDRGPDDHFGHTVAIERNHCVVGAVADDTDAFGSNLLNNSGAAFVYETDQSGKWQMIEKIVAFDRDHHDIFGDAVDLNGTNIIIGAKLEDNDLTLGNYLTNAGSVYVFEYPSFVSIEENLNELTVNVYPIPFNNTLYINIEKPLEFTELKIFNLLGKNVFEKTYRNQSKIEIDLQQLHSGIYIMQMQSENASFNTRIIKTSN